MRSSNRLRPGCRTYCFIIRPTPTAAAFILCAGVALLGQDAVQSRRGVEWQTLMDRTQLLPLERAVVVIQPPKPGWTVGGRIISVAATSNGELAYVFVRADRDHDPVLVVDRDGRIVRAWGRGLFTVPHNIKVDEEGNIWTTDAGPGKVMKFSPEGKVLLEFVLGDTPAPASGGCAFLASPANGNLDFCGATDVTTTRDGRIFVTDGYGRKRVLEYTPRGDARVREWGGAGTDPGMFTLPHGLATDGRVLYVADREGGRIARFDLDGRPLGDWAHVGNPGALAYANGSLWAAVANPPPAPGQANLPPAGGRGPWVVRINPATGEVLGKVPTAGTDYVHVTANGEVYSGATQNGFYRNSPARSTTGR
jgi:sugar lactone lactonase YvrE